MDNILFQKLLEDLHHSDETLRDRMVNHSQNQSQALESVGLKEQF